MVKTKAKRLLSLLLALAMVMSLTVTPVYAADDDDSTSSGTTASETGETVPEPEQADEDTEADALEEDASEEVTSDQQADLNAGISLSSTDEDGEEEETSSETEAESTDEVTLPEADTNGLITLTEDVALTGQYIVESDKNITIDLNGHSITRGTNNTYNFVIVVNSGATLTIKDSNPGTNTIAGGVYAYGTLNIESGTIAPSTSWGIEVSGGTVTVSGGTINAYYGIIVNSGSLKVEEDATITATYRAVEVGSSATVTISGGTLNGGTYGVYVLGNGSATISGGTISAKRGIIVYSGSLEVKDGATITATNRVVEVTTSSASATISGGTLTGGTYAVMNYGGALNISGGSISGTNTGIYHDSGTTTVTGGTIYGKTYGAKVLGGTLNASGGSISCGEKTNAWAYGIYVDSSNSAATVTLSGTVEVTANNTVGYGAAVVLFNTLNGNDSTSGVVTTLNVQDNAKLTGSSYGISGNGSYSGNQVTAINISGGTVTGEWGIYHPQYGDLNISGGTITGSSTGVEIRAGNLTVTGGTITAEGDPGSSTENGNGTTTVGAAIAVVQHTTKRDINVTITEAEGSTTSLSGYYGIFEADLEENGEDYTKNVSITVEAGTVTTTSDDEDSVAIYHDTSSAATVAVTGGTYSSDVTEYVATGSVAVSSDGSYIVITATENNVAAIISTSGAVTQYTSLSDAIDAVSSGETVVLLANVTLTDTLKIYKSITLELGDYTITSSASDKALYTTQSLVINADEGGISASAGSAITNQKGSGTGTLTINGGTYTSSSTYAIYNNNGTVIVNGGKIESTASSKDGICCYADATVTVNGGTISGTRYGVYSTGTLTVTGGEISGTKAGAYLSGGTATISGGTIKSDSGEGLKDAGATSVTITGGTFTGKTHAVNVSSSVTVSGGTFTATGSKTDYAVAFYIDGATVTFSGGTFSGMYSTAWIKADSNGEIKYATGYGAVDSDGKTASLTANNSSDSEALVRYVTLVSPVAAITVDDTTTNYATIADAIEAAGETDTTITLLASTNEDVVIPAGATVTLDLAGYTLTNSTSHTITNYGTLTITDSSATVDTDGTLTCGTVDNVTHGKAAVYNDVGATCTILAGQFTRSQEAGTSSSDNGGNSYYTILNHGTMTIGSSATENTNDCISVSNTGGYSSMIENGWQDGSQNTTAVNSVMTIYGGTFTGGLYNVKNDDYGVLNIYGGTFSGKNNVLNWNTLTISGGNFTSTNMGVYTGYGDDTMDKGQTTITSGTFSTDGKVVNTYNSGVTYTITGGSYSDNSADTYLTGTSYQLAYKDNEGTTLDYKVVNVIYGKNIKLEEGKIILNVYVTNNDVSGTDSISGELEDETETTRTTITAESTGNYAYVLSQKVYANMMAKTLTVTVALSDGYEVTYTTSVREYCVDVLTADTTSESATITTEQQTVAKAMLNYGAAAQNYSGYDTDNLANKDYEYETGADELKDASTMYSNGAKLTTKTDSDYNGVKLSTMNVVFDYDFTVKLTFTDTLTDGVLSSVSLNGTTLKQDEDYTVSGKVITITGLSAAEMAETISIVTTDTLGYTKTSNLPGLYYAYLSAKSTDEAKQLLGQTLYAYCNAVVALNSTSTNATNE